ncbi:hypothetical protein LguiA_008782 [Lonicera macranthoides]
MALIPLPNSNVWINGLVFEPDDSDLLLNYLMPHLGQGQWMVPAGRPHVVDAISPVDVEGDNDPQDWYNEHLKPFQDIAYFFRILTRYYSSNGCHLKFRRQVGNQPHPKWVSKYSPVPIYDEDKNLLGFKQEFRYENPYRPDHLLWNLTEYKTIDVNQWERVLCKLEKNPKKAARRRVSADASTTVKGPKPAGNVLTLAVNAAVPNPRPTGNVRTLAVNAAVPDPVPTGNVRTLAVNAAEPAPAPTRDALYPTTQRNRWRRIYRTVSNFLNGEPTAGVQAGPAISNTENSRRRPREGKHDSRRPSGEIVDVSDG